MNEIAEQLKTDPENLLLGELSKQTRTLEAQLAVMRGQETLQRLFVDTHIAVLGNGMRKLFDVTFNDKPAKMEIVDYYARNTNDAVSIHNSEGARVFVYDAMEDTVLCDLSLSRAKGDIGWKAEVAPYPENWHRASGNPGLHWKNASDLFGDKAVDSAIDGLLPEVVDVAQAIREVAAKILP